MRRLVVMLVTLLIAGMVASLPGPAQAEAEFFTDDRRTPGGMDIKSVRVINNKGQGLKVRVNVENLQPRGWRSMQVRIDTNRLRRGPEYRLWTGIYRSHYDLTRERNWRTVGLRPCRIYYRQSFRHEFITFRLANSRFCMGRYGKVRVSVQTNLGPTTDHSPGRRQWHEWVRRG